MDLITNIFEVHYDSRWVVSNTDMDDLSRRLGKQKEKEKQQMIHNLDTMSDEKRASTVELQNIGVVSMYHQAAAANEDRIISEYSSVDDTIDTELIGGELNDLQNVPLEGIDEGYYNENDFDEDGVTGDEMHDFNQEDLLDNNFDI